MARRTTELPTAEDTEALGERLGALLNEPLVLACYGDLGAGKTTLARGVARGLGASAPVTSPTFVLQHIDNSGRLPFYHFDAYRLSSARALLELGWEECDDGVILLEWSERVPEALPADRLDIHLSPETRVAELVAHGPVAERVLAALC